MQHATFIAILLQHIELYIGKSVGFFAILHDKLQEQRE